jgi:hypothetical protein
LSAAWGEEVARNLRLAARRLARAPAFTLAAVPYERWLNMGFRRADGPHAAEETATTDLLYVTPEYFQTLRIPLLRGRGFTAADREGSAPVVIVTQAFVHKYLRDQEPLGSHLALNDRKREIVGIVGDAARASGWGGAGPLASLPAAFIPVAQVPDSLLKLVHTWFSPSWIVRTRGTPAGYRRRRRERHSDRRASAADRPFPRSRRGRRRRWRLTTKRKDLSAYRSHLPASWRVFTARFLLAVNASQP